MILSIENLHNIPAGPRMSLPGENIFELPEKVIQFGTGVLLRGLPDFFIDKANKGGIFNGRIIVVKSTIQGGTDAFKKQDNLYTQLVRGIKDSSKTDEIIINASISRVLSALEEWKEILSCAANPDLQIIISNTTEVGIKLVEDNVFDSPPVSFPGKLLAFLLERYHRFNGSRECGMVIIPTELIPGNGLMLKKIVIELAIRNGLNEAFIQWLNEENDFCNSLVDRIVPGKLPDNEQREMESMLGFTDELMIMSEAYKLWAIETSNEKTKEVLSFQKADQGVVIASDINKFRELKLRLLNGSHTFTAGLAVLAGYTTVKQAMDDGRFSSFIGNLMMVEITPSITNQFVSLEEAKQFASQVLERYRNPFIEHFWLSICLQFTSKMAMRNVPVILSYYKKNKSVPKHMALGFAAYLLFMKSELRQGNQYVGRVNGFEYTINDDMAKRLHEAWNCGDNKELVNNILQDMELWGTDLSLLPGFSDAIIKYLEKLNIEDALSVLNKFGVQKIF